MTTRHVCGAISLIVALVGAAPAGAQRVDYDSIAGQWTLSSGPAVYRLASRHGEIVLDYFGPSPATAGWSTDSGATPLRELTGLADGMVLDSSLRLIAQARRAIPNGSAELRLVYRHARLPLEVEARYTAWGATGVFSRELTYVNRGSAPIRLESSPVLDLTLPRGDYALRYLYGGWGQERRLAEEKVGAGTRSFVQRHGRSSNGYVPWLSLRNETSGIEYVADLAWSGNWSMSVERQPGASASAVRDQQLAVTMAMRNDFGGALTLAAGERLALPRVAFTAARGTIDDAANQMHRYQREFVMARSASNDPPLVQFNSWYGYGTDVNVENMKQAADVAAALGAEAYVMDSGWYTDGDWSRRLGDYVPNAKAFPTGVGELSRYVRGKGMKFGLWVEIENVGQESRTFHDHPDWCMHYRGRPVIAWDRCQLDFAKPAVRRWARATIDRLVQTGGVDWLKIDYNIDIGEWFDGPSGAAAASRRRGDELYRHVMAYYAWLDELRAAYPALVVEGCSSGALRFDGGMIAHTHTTWVSDNVDPRTSLQLGYGCSLQFAPEICNHWMVGDDDRGNVNQAADPGWWDFMFRVPMQGQYGISSKIVGWSPALRARAAANVALYKRIRSTITGSDVYHLTPMPDPVAPVGWMAVQYAQPGGARSAVLAYRLPNGETSRTFALRGLVPSATYDIVRDGEASGQATGAELATGLVVALGAEWRAAVIELVRR
jgi:alpha-galactosidase